MPPPDSVVLHLRARRGFAAVDFSELWRYSDLLWILAVRDIKVRYKQAALGAAWAVLQPLAAMVVFTVFFGYFAGLNAKIESGVPYPLYAFCALLPWQLFAHAIASSSNSLVDNQSLITKTYFPRLLIPFAAIIGGLMDFAVAFAIMIVLMAAYGAVPGWTLLWLPLLVVLTVLTALSVGLWLAALSAMYRDFRHTTGFLLQIWLFATPVVYPSSIVPPQWQTLYGLNPMVGIVDGFRWALLGTAAPAPSVIAVSALEVVLLFILGAIYFRRIERTMADWI
jgi:homopolymeric O-antigen transport system permease protein